jgi:hypothetical protein
VTTRSERKTRSAERRRRASGYLAQLAWLAGFPAGTGGWQPLAGEPFALTGERIARARRVGRTLLREHGEELPALVGDVERWWRIVDATLAWCSKPSGPLDLSAHAPPRVARAARDLAARVPALATTIAAASVAWAHEPEQLARVLGWLAHRATELAELELAVSIALCRCATADAAGADALLALLRVDAPDGQQAIQRVHQLEKCVRDGRPLPLAEIPRSTPIVVGFLRALSQQEEPEHALALVAAVDLAAALAPWVAWEKSHAALFERAAAYAARPFDSEDRHDQRIIASLRTAHTRVLPQVPLDGALVDLDFIAKDPRYRRAATRFLAAAPREQRVRLLLHVGRVVARADDDERPAWLWDAIADAVDSAAAPTTIYAPWEKLARVVYVDVEDDLVDARPTRAQVRELVAALARLARTAPLHADDHAHALAWVLSGLTGDALDAAVVASRRLGRELPPEHARAVRTLAAADDGEQLLALARPLLEAVDDRWRARAEVAALVEHAERDGAAWVLRRALLDGHGRELVAAASIAALVPRSRWPAFRVATPSSGPVARHPAALAAALAPAHERLGAVVPDAEPVAATPARGWVARYPAALAPALERLAAVIPDAEAVAARRLAPDIVDPEALRREAETLRARPALTERQAIRLANLDRRLRAPRLPSEKRLAHLVDRVEQTAAALALARFVAAATAAASARLVRAFDLGSWPGWSLEPRERELLLELLRLEGPERSLAGRLLRARAGPPPWDLRDDPPNRAFLDELRARGIDPEPWLDTAPRTFRAHDGKPVELALCGDPLEVFAMGAHFQTCLSPGGGNFFSVVANAADINKRVLYARRDGGVVGRCLFALTTTHALLTFQVYSHLAGVNELVRVFAIDLAERMRTTIVPRGTVPTLVASNWYDDGPRDLVGRFGALDRLDFATLSPATVVAELRATLGHDLDDITLPIVLASHGLWQHPELVGALASTVLARRHLPAQTFRDAASLAMRAGDLALADRLLGEHVAGVSFEYALNTHAVLLARLRPSLALAALRESRDRSVRRAEDDRPDRNALAAVALHALHRPRQAAAMLALALRGRPELAGDLGYYGIGAELLQA